MLEQVKKLCRAYDIRPSRQKGQNFVVSKKVIEQMVGAAEIKPTDTIVEVGPGLGILTQALIQRAEKVISVELDDKLFAALQAQFAGVKNLVLVRQDILQFAPADYQLTDYKIVANLPYNITSFFIRKFLTAERRPSTMTLMLQQEVAKRICASPGQLSLLGLSVQLYATPRLVVSVERKNFWPQPNVDSAIIVIDQIKNQSAVGQWLGEVSESAFWRLVKTGFSNKRKQLHNNLAAGLNLSSAEIKKALSDLNLDPKIRPQSLSLDNWRQLARKLKVYLN
jgi:16S rRNA (adenine1518-N6/adenine1519-N6)-dimethyltransferase